MGRWHTLRLLRFNAVARDGAGAIMMAKARSFTLVPAISFALLGLAGCANRAPVTLSSQFTPPNNASWSSPQANRADAGPADTCRIRLGDVLDARADPQDLGDIGGRPIHQADQIAWLRSGLMSLNRDSRIQIVDAAATEKPDLEVSVELLKAYVISITSDKSTNVVLRIRYARQGAALGEQIYRGTDTGVNWISGGDETQASLDYALAQILGDVDRDILARCDAEKTAVSK
jgi:hypothetical protein